MLKVMNAQSVFATIKKHCVEIILFLILIALFVFLYQYSSQTFYQSLGSDMVFDFMENPKTISERGVFFNDFVGSHEMILSKPFFVTIFFNWFLNDWLHAAVLTTLCMGAIILIILSILLRMLGYSHKSILIAYNFILCANFFSAGQLFFHFNTYSLMIVFIILYVILILGFKIHGFNLRKPKDLAKFIVLCLISIWCGFISLRMVAILLFPLFIMELFTVVVKIRGEEKVFTPVIKYSSFNSSILFLLLGVIGYAISIIYNNYAQAFVPTALSINSFEQTMKAIPITLLNIIGQLQLRTSGITSSNIRFMPLVLELTAKVAVYFLCAVGLLDIYKNKKTNSKTVIVVNIVLISLAVTILMALFTSLIGERYFFVVWYLVTILILLTV